MIITPLKTEEIGFRCASALLLYRGQISVKDIQALPLVEDDSQAELIVESLKQKYNVEINTEKISNWPILEWDEIIRLKTFEI
jgi:hypothetical protein